MAKLNRKASIAGSLENHPDKTTNYEGGIAFKMPPKVELYTRVASCLVGEKKFYSETDEAGKEKTDKDFLVPLIAQVAKEDPEFILQLAAYTRNKLYLRTVSQVLLAEASLLKECKPYVRKYTPLIVQRADELTEVTAYLRSRIGDLGNKKRKGSMPSALKRGLADAFEKFDAYQLAKYNRKGSVKFKDVLRLVHPKPKDEERSKIYKAIIEDTLPIPDTWEVVISTKGSTKDNWEAIAPSMGYMALLRNLRNLLDKDVGAMTLSVAVNRLKDEKEIQRAKQLPFRYFSAYKSIMPCTNVQTSRVLDAISDALDQSVKNVPRLSGSTYILADNSGSMMHPLSAKSTVFLADVANLFLAIAHQISESPVTAVFATETKRINLSSRDSVLANMDKCAKLGQTCGGGTDAWKTIQYLLDNKLKVDRIILFSDMQCYNATGWGNESLAQLFKKYKASINPNVRLYSIDLAGHGTAQFPQDEPNVALLAGYSERVLDFIQAFEEDKAQAVERIKKEATNGLQNVSED